MAGRQCIVVVIACSVVPAGKGLPLCCCGTRCLSDGGNLTAMLYMQGSAYLQGSACPT